MYGNLLDAKINIPFGVMNTTKWVFLKHTIVVKQKKTNIGARNVYMATHALI